MIDYTTAKESRQKRHIEKVKLKESSPDWLASSVNYQVIHQWLKRNFGSLKSCDHCGLVGEREKGGRWNIHYALKKGYRHSHNRSAYLGLCRPCHAKYDWNEQKTRNMIAAAHMQKGSHSKIKSLVAKKRKRDQFGHFINIALNTKTV